MHHIDPRRILSSPLVYSIYRSLVSSQREHAIFASEYIRARPRDRVLDVGCGPAYLLADLPPSVEYVGLDMNAAYIRSARKRYGDKARFLCGGLESDTIADELGAHSFDIVVAHGLLHHLNNTEALAFLKLADLMLKPGGRLVSLDGCYVPRQSRIARYLLFKDRGKYVRDEAGYLHLAHQAFKVVRSVIRDDLYRIPYTLILIECVAEQHLSSESQ